MKEKSSKPTESENAGSDAAGYEEKIQPDPGAPGDDAAKKIAEDTKEFFGVRSLKEAEFYFTALPVQHHPKLVDSLVSKAVESKEADAQLVADFFARSTNKCSAIAFEKGFSDIAETIEDIAIDAPKAVQHFVVMLKGAKLDGKTNTRIAARSSGNEIFIALLQSSHSEKGNNYLIICSIV